MVPASRAEPKSSRGSLPREEVIGSTKVIHNYCRLGREMPYTHQWKKLTQLCGNPSLLLEFVALLPWKELRNHLVLKIQAGK